MCGEGGGVAELLVRCGDPTHPTATRHPSEEGILATSHYSRFTVRYPLLR
jgi:hypothetical protein